jgi:endonuclease/exonuclease/phosphatase family metal-dependent hydrolase
MVKKRKRLSLITAALILAACDSGPARPDGTLTILSWNVQALFDGKNDGNEYAEYREAAGWNSEKYRNRLNNMASALKHAFASFSPYGGENADAVTPAGDLPDILVFIEVENGLILEDMAKLPGMGVYRHSFFGRAGDASLGLGVLSRYPITGGRTHSAHQYGAETPRPVAEVRIDAGAPLVLLACHWKSKLGGAEETEAQRRAAAAVVNRLLAEIAAETPRLPVIVLGDLNENHDEAERVGGAYVCALMNESAAGDLRETGSAAVNASGANRRGGRSRQNPASPRAGFRDYLILSEKPPAPERGDDVLYSPWMDGGWQGLGSYYYGDEWETIDHLLFDAACFDGAGWDFGAFGVVAAPPFTGGGVPDAYNPRTGNGLSDHLPLAATLILR